MFFKWSKIIEKKRTKYVTVTIWFALIDTRLKNLNGNLDYNLTINLFNSFGNNTYDTVI